MAKNNSCKPVKTKKYKERKSPPYHANDCKGQTKKGNDGNDYKSVPNIKRVYSWKLISKTVKRKKKEMLFPKGKKYQILDNGGRPFTVIIDGNKAYIYKTGYGFDDTNESSKNENNAEFIKEYTYKNIWYGENDKWNRGKYWKKGNSILLQIGENKYVYIGSKIFAFNAKSGDTINKYFSPIGNSDVPYPYAVGEKYTYFMIEDAAVLNEWLDSEKEPYSQVYGREPGRDGDKIKENDKEPFDNVVIIHKRLI